MLTIPAAGRAVPFVRMTDFLPPASRDRLLRDVLAAREQFAPARTRGVPDHRTRVLLPARQPE